MRALRFPSAAGAAADAPIQGAYAPRSPRALAEREHDVLGACEIRGMIISPSGVLYDDTLWWRWLVQLLARIGLHTQPAAFWELWRRDFYDDVCLGRRELWEALREMLLGAGLAAGQADEVCAAARPRWRTLGEGPHPLPGVLATLARLAAGDISLAIIAHAPQSADQFAAQLRQSGLAKYFHLVLSSRALRSCPWQPEFLAGALQQWPIPPQQTALVSSDPGELEAAAQASLRTVALNCPAAEQADASLSRIEQLPLLALRAPRRAAAG